MSSEVANALDEPQSRAIRACCPVVELRQYTLHPGQREMLIALFDSEFVETQEAVGMRVIAQFRDIERPDVFTWLRGFSDMPTRATALRAFYEGPVWTAHRDAANRTMIDFDNVRLLRPARPGSGFMLDDTERPPRGSIVVREELIVCTIYMLSAAAAPGFAELFERIMAPVLGANGASPIAVFETEPSANNFPRLPVREGEHAFVWFARFRDVGAYDRHVAALERSRDWRELVCPMLDRQLEAPTEVWRLAPTARSQIPG
jgi:hypothetical protein